MTQYVYSQGAIAVKYTCLTIECWVFWDAAQTLTLYYILDIIKYNAYKEQSIDGHHIAMKDNYYLILREVHTSLLFKSCLDLYCLYI